MEELWTPWRMRYITANKEAMGCVFCPLAAPGGDDRLVLFHGAHCFVVMNLFPYTVGHLMIVPHRHVARCGDLEDTELVELGDLAARAEAVLRGRLGAERVHHGINLGRAAGAGVEGHLHLHLVPRGGRIVEAGTGGSLPVPLDETRALLLPGFAHERQGAPR